MIDQNAQISLNGVMMIDLVCCYCVLGWGIHSDAASYQSQMTSISQTLHIIHINSLTDDLLKLYLTCLSWLVCPPPFLSSGLLTEPRLSPSLVQVSLFLFPKNTNKHFCRHFSFHFLYCVVSVVIYRA